MTKNMKMGILGAGVLALLLAWRSRRAAAAASDPTGMVAGGGVLGLTNGTAPPVDSSRDCMCSDPSDLSIRYACGCEEAGALLAPPSLPPQMQLDGFAVRSEG